MRPGFRLTFADDLPNLRREFPYLLLSNHTILPSGNPDGSTAKVRHRILRDIRAEFEPMTALERVAYAQIEALLKTAARAGDPLARIRAHNSVSRLLRQIRAGRVQSRRPMRASGELTL